MVQITKSVVNDVFPPIDSKKDGWINLNLRIPKPSNPASTQLECVGLTSYHIPTKPYMSNGQINEGKFFCGFNSKRNYHLPVKMSYAEYDKLSQAIVGSGGPTRYG